MFSAFSPCLLLYSSVPPFIFFVFYFLTSLSYFFPLSLFYISFIFSSLSIGFFCFLSSPAGSDFMQIFLRRHFLPQLRKKDRWKTLIISSPLSPSQGKIVPQIDSTLPYLNVKWLKPRDFFIFPWEWSFHGLILHTFNFSLSLI